MRIIAFIPGVRGHNWVDPLGLIGVDVGVAALVSTGAISLYHHKIDSLRRLVGPGGWVAACVDPLDQGARRALIMTSDGVSLVERSGSVVRLWPWPSIREVRVRQVPIGLAHHTGLEIGLTDGTTRELLLPSHSTLSYPPALAEAAVSEMLRRRALRRDRTDLRTRTGPAPAQGPRPPPRPSNRLHHAETQLTGQPTRGAKPVTRSAERQSGGPDRTEIRVAAQSCPRKLPGSGPAGSSQRLVTEYIPKVAQPSHRRSNGWAAILDHKGDGLPMAQAACHNVGDA